MGSRSCTCSSRPLSAPLPTPSYPSRDKHSRWPEELLHEHVHPPHHLRHQKVLSKLVEGALGFLFPRLGGRQTEVLGRGPSRCRIRSPGDNLRDGCGRGGDGANCAHQRAGRNGGIGKHDVNVDSVAGFEGCWQTGRDFWCFERPSRGRLRGWCRKKTGD